MDTLCPQCGNPTPPDALFCGRCGTALPGFAPGQPATGDSPPVTIWLEFGPTDRLELAGALEYFAGRRDPADDWYPAVDLTDRGGEEGGVSRHHARIFVDNAKAYIEDRNSLNGTFAQGERLPPLTPHLLREGDMIAFASVQASVRISRGEHTQTA